MKRFNGKEQLGPTNNAALEASQPKPSGPAAADATRVVADEKEVPKRGFSNHGGSATEAVQGAPHGHRHRG